MLDVELTASILFGLYMQGTLTAEAAMANWQNSGDMPSHERLAPWQIAHSILCGQISMCA